jgi:hypothetical protein
MRAMQGMQAGGQGGAAGGAGAGANNTGAGAANPFAQVCVLGVCVRVCVCARNIQEVHRKPIV